MMGGTNRDIFHSREKDGNTPASYCVWLFRNKGARLGQFVALDMNHKCYSTCEGDGHACVWHGPLSAAEATDMAFALNATVKGIANG